MRILFIIFFALITVDIAGQAPDRFYTKFGSTGIDIAYDVKQIYDKQYIIIGSTSGFGAKATDAYLLLVDSMGKPIWQKTIGGMLSETGKSIVFNPQDSGFIFTGFSNSIGNGGYDIWIVRTDKNGDVKWERNFGGLDWDFGNSITISSDNNLLVCGTAYSSFHGAKDGVILKYNMNGTLLWNKYFGGINDDEFNVVIPTKDNQLIVAGYTKSFNEPNGDNYILKLDLNGDTLFTRRTGGSGFDYVNDILQKNSSEEYIYTGGSSSYTNVPYTQSYMTCMNKFGNQLWTNNFYASNNSDESFVSICENTINPIYTYYLRNVPVPNFKINGNIFYSPALGWPTIVNSFGGFEDEKFYNSCSTSDGGAVCVGSTLSFESQDQDVFFIKLDSNIINYSNAIGLNENNILKSKRPIIKVYSVEKQITIYNEFKNDVIVNIYNMEGKLMGSIKNEHMMLSIDYSIYPTGIYIVSVNSEGSVQTIKFLNQ